MDESSLDPRLRDSGEEKSIVVNSGNSNDNGDNNGEGRSGGTSIVPAHKPPQDYHQSSSHLPHTSSHSSQPPHTPHPSHPPHPQETQQSHSKAVLSTPTSTRITQAPPSSAGIHNSITANPTPAASESVESQYHATSTPTPNALSIGPGGGAGAGGAPIAPLPFTPNTPNTPTAVYEGDATPQDPNDPKRPRACEACRGLKVKCEPDPTNPDGPCKRCAKAGRNCVVTQPTRKRQKKTDSRVAELEKKIDALTASLQATRGSGSGPSNASNSNANGNGIGNGQQPPATSAENQNSFARLPPYGSATPWPAPPSRDNHSGYGTPLERTTLATPAGNAAGQKRKFSEAQTSPDFQNPTASQRPQGFPGFPDTFDPVGKGLITAELAETLLQRYNNEMAPHLPAVVFPPSMTAAALRKSKPYLFLGVMATATSEMAQIQRQLANEVVHLIADRIVIRGEKSMELVQLLLLAVIWYYPPEHFEELKFYQFVHMAAVLAIDIGLGKKRNAPKSRLFPASFRDSPIRRSPLPDPTTIEARRTWLASYFLASNVAMALHRTNLVRWSPFMTECMDILESSPEAAPTDRYLCNLVWTHRLAEEVGIQFSMDDPSVSVSISEPKIQYALRGFERDMAKYKDSIRKEDRQPSLLLSFNVLSLYMHEVALHVDKNDDLRPPHSTEGLGDPIPGLSESLTAAHISALSSCLTAIDGIFEVFLSMDVRSIRCLPVFNFVRVAYATVVLIKMYFSAKSPDSELGGVIDKDNMKVEEYLDKLLDKFRAVSDGDKSRPAAKFQLVLVMLRGWFQKQGEGQSQGQKQAAPPQKAQENPPGNEIVMPQQGGAAAPQPRPSGGPQQQSDYNPANTPLQLLSEIATGNDPSSRPKQQNGGVPSPAGSMPSYQPPPFAPAPSAPQQQQQQQLSMYDAGSSAAMAGQQQHLPTPINWLGQGWADFDFDDPGDGFQQAMGLTLQGIGGGPVSNDWEDTMRQVMVGGGGGIGSIQAWVGPNSFFQD